MEYYYSWSVIKSTIEAFFQAPISINSFFYDKALIKINADLNCKLIDGQWKEYDKMHLKMEHWFKSLHSLPSFIKWYGGWISIENLVSKGRRREHW